MNNGVELRHLRHFIALAEELHFGRAAKRCNISQPPFSVSIRQLEESFGLPLVVRSTHEVRLTAAGATYYEEALRVLSQFERAHLNASRVSHGLEGSLDVGLFASMLYRGLDRAVRRFQQDNPGVGLRLIELSTADQIPALLRRRIQYGFVHTAKVPGGVLSQELLAEPFVLCLPCSHAAAGASTAELKNFEGEDFVLFSRAFSPADYDQVAMRARPHSFTLGCLSPRSPTAPKISIASCVVTSPWRRPCRKPAVSTSNSCSRTVATSTPP